MAVGIVGLGYVGLPLAVAFAKAGETVVALDIGQQTLSDISAGTSTARTSPGPLNAATSGPAQHPHGPRRHHRGLCRSGREPVPRLCGSWRR